MGRTKKSWQVVSNNSPPKNMESCPKSPADLNLNLSLTLGVVASVSSGPEFDPTRNFTPAQWSHSIEQTFFFLPHQISPCLSHRHLRLSCQNRVRCLPCFRLGHVALHCRFPSRFPGLHLLEGFPSFSAPAEWDFPSFHSWFLVWNTCTMFGIYKCCWLGTGRHQQAFLAPLPEMDIITLSFDMML